MNNNNHSPAQVLGTDPYQVTVPGFWGSPTLYSVAAAGGVKLYATQDRKTRTVATLRTADIAVGEQIAAAFNFLTVLADHGNLQFLLRGLADFGVDVAGLANLDDPWDEKVGVVTHLVRLLDIEALPVADGGRTAAAALLHLIAAAAAEPAASGRALTAELVSVLRPLDGTVVRAEYDGGAIDLNVAPWVDALTDEQIGWLLLDDRRGRELCDELLYSWSAPGGVLEDWAEKIENDTDFGLVVSNSDVIRRLATSRPQLIAKLYTPAVLADLFAQTWGGEEAETAKLFLTQL